MDASLPKADGTHDPSIGAQGEKPRREHRHRSRKPFDVDDARMLKVISRIFASDTTRPAMGVFVFLVRRMIWIARSKTQLANCPFSSNAMKQPVESLCSRFAPLLSIVSS